MSVGVFRELLVLYLDQISLMFSLFDVFLILVLELDVVFHLVFDLLVFLRENSLQVIDFILLLLKVIPDARVLLLVLFKLVSAGLIFVAQLVDVGLHLQNLPIDFGNPTLKISDRLADLFNLVCHFFLLGLAFVVLAQHFFVLRVQYDTFFF